MSTENNATAAATGAAKDEGYKIHIGNLPFSATEEQVRELIAPVGGEVLKVELPQRFGRPGGYAFVHYKEASSATAAEEKLNGQEFSERKLKVAKGRSEEEQAERRKENQERRDAAKAAKAEKAAEAKAANGGATTEGEAGEQTKKKRASKPRSRRRQPGEGEGEDEAGEAAGDASDAAPKPRRRSEKKGGRIDDAAGEETLVERKPRQKREPKMELTGEQSKTTIFVANLPFSVDDDALAAIFTNLSINVKSAKVVTGLRRVKPGSRPFRGSKGFGFVEVADPAQQQEAVDKVNGSLVAERAITAKIANEMREIEKQEVKEEIAA